MRPDQPPPPVPWERRDLSRKQETAAASDAPGGATPRWRDPLHGPRELPRSAPTSRAPSSGLYSCTLSRSERLLPEGERLRPSGRHGVIGARDSRGSLRRSPYRSPSDDSSRRPLPPPPPPPPPTVTGLRSLAVPISTTPSQPLKDQNGTNVDIRDASLGASMVQKPDRDHLLGPMGWKPGKWSRPSSVSLAKVEDTVTKETPSSLVTSPQGFDEGVPRKKARLGWGQGLAKYEKQKVQGSMDSPSTGAESGLSDTSPSMAGPEGCPSLLSPFSPRCSSSPVIMEEKPCTSATSCDIGTSNCDLSGVDSQCKEFAIKLDNFEVKSASSLKALLDDLLQPEDACSGDSSSTRHAAMNKVLMLKVDISKEIEKTECEIDFLEGELKSLNSDVKSHSCYFASSLPIIDASKPCLVSSDGAPKNDTPLEGHEVASSAVAQLEPEHPSSSCSLTKQDNVLTDLKTVSSQALYSICEEPTSLNEGICHAEQCKPAENTIAMEINGLELQGTQHLAPLDDKIVTKCGDRSLSFIKASSSSSYSNLISLIMSSNRDIANRASGAFHKVLPSDPPRIDIWESVKLSSQTKNDAKIKENISVRKRLLKFKLRVLTLKFMAFHHLWKEDLRLLSIKKNHTKSNKRLDLSSRSSHIGSQKLRSSARSRFVSPEGTLAPPSEVLDLMCKLLSESRIKLFRSNLRMPSMILDNEERRFRKFVNKNGLIEDPPSVEQERSMVNPWTQEEKEIFMEMLATFGKDFTKISSSLNHKTTADCIEYYYKNHKSESFQEAKKRLGIIKQSNHLPSNTYLVTSGRKWNHEMNAVALDMLEAASVVAAYSHRSVKSKQRDDGRSMHRSPVDELHNAELSMHERESEAADVLAGISSAVSSEGLSSCVTGSIGQAGKINFSQMGQPISQNFDDDSCSEEDCGGVNSTDWTDDEKSNFVQALSIYGKDFAMISNYLGTRSREQCKTFFSKARSSLDLDVIHHGNGNTGMTSDMNGGRSDTDDACAADIDSAICSTQSCSKVTGDVSQHATNANCEGLSHGSSPVQSEVDRSSEQDATGGVDFAESCVSKQESTVHEGKLISGEDNPCSCDALKGSGDAALSCNDSKCLPENAEKIDAESRIIGSDVDVHVAQHVIEAPAPVDFDTISHSGGVIRQKDTRGKSSTNMLKREVNLPHSVVNEIASKNQRRASFDLGASSSVICFAQDISGNESILQKGRAVGVTLRPTSAPSYQHQELLSHMLKQENFQPMLSSAFCDPSSVSFAGSPHITSQTTLNFQEHANRQHQNSVTRELHQQHILRKASLSQFNHPMHVLKGYPLQMLHQKEIKREEDLASERSVLLDSSLKQNVFPLSTQFVSSMQNGISNVLSHPQLGSGILCACKADDTSENQTRYRSQTATPKTENQPKRPGDVKLFGKIITQPPSLQNADTSLHESKSKPPSPKLNGSLNIMPSSIVKDNGVFSSRAGSNGHVSLSGQPGTSYGFWDANGSKAGFSSLSESARILASYQALGAPFITGKYSRPSSNIALADYQQPYMQQLSSDGTRNDNFSLLQSRNTVDVIPGSRQSGSMSQLGANMVSNEGVFIAGKGISDPVAVLKMHYASTSSSKASDAEFQRRDIDGR